MLSFQTVVHHSDFHSGVFVASSLTSSTRPKPPTPSVAMTSRWSKGLDDEKVATISFSWMMSGDSGWLWWRDTDFLNGATDKQKSDSQSILFTLLLRR